MTLRSIVILLVVLSLTLAAACGGSDAGTPKDRMRPDIAHKTVTAMPTAKAYGAAAATIPTQTGEPAGLGHRTPSPTRIEMQGKKGSICDPLRFAPNAPGVILDPAPHVMNYSSRGDWVDENYIRWSPDGSQILFDVSKEQYKGPVDLYRVAADGSILEQVMGSTINIPIWASPSTMVYFDVSPDGSRFAFSTCTYVRKSSEDEGEDEWGYNYDIALANLDGTDVKRLTETPDFENFPVWSPNGTHVAYISSPETWVRPRYGLEGRSGQIRGEVTVHTLSTDESRDIAISMGELVAPYPPTWSPDGQRLAFVTYEGRSSSSIYRWSADRLKASVWTVGANGSGLTRITDAACGPAWSPDGQRIAVAVPKGPKNAELYTFAANGSDPVLVSGNLPVPWDYPVQPWMGNLSWSPDGSAILFKDFAHMVNLDGSQGCLVGFGSLIEGYQPTIPMLAAWSPDGSKIAIRAEDPEKSSRPAVLVYVMDRDGSNARILVESVYDQLRHSGR